MAYAFAVTGSGVRKVLLLCGALALAALLAACSGGSAHVSAGPATTVASQSTATTSGASAKKKAATAAARKHAATRAAQSSATGAKAGATGATGVAAGGSSSAQSQSSSAATTGTTAAPQSDWEIIGAPTTTTTWPTPKPYDPTKPIDLSGTPGVTPAEQARAEQLVRDTLRDLPRYASTAAAYADGYRSINDGVTGTEHYVKWAYVDDGHILDSKYPESLVYQYRNGVQTLVSAMYMLPFGARFTDAPDVGGPLTQWHIHNNLCLVDNPTDPLQKVVGGLTGSDGSCPPGSTKAASSPMLHVWIVANPCGPFAPLEGIEGGQVAPGQPVLCDRAHGSG